jgi:hypothetical protein
MQQLLLQAAAAAFLPSALIAARTHQSRSTASTLANTKLMPRAIDPRSGLSPSSAAAAASHYKTNARGILPAVISYKEQYQHQQQHGPRELTMIL